MIKSAFLLISLFAFGTLHAQVVTYVNSASLPPPAGYSTTVEIDLGTARMIIVSGLVAFDKERNVIGPGDMAKQVEVIFTNLKRIAEDAGGSISDVVKIGVFLTDMSQLQTFRNVRDQFVSKTHPPASTTVQVSGLVKAGLVAEVEATIVIPK